MLIQAKFPDGTEMRSAGVVCQLHTASGGRRLQGYAALFDVPAMIGGPGAGGFRELVKPGAFRAAIAPGADIVALADHNPAAVLGRTASGTLQLSEDAKGLAFDLDVPDTAAGRDMVTLAQRNDLGGMSFGFTVPKGGEIWQGDTRELHAITLHEISVVSAFPAYSGTSVQARARCYADPARERARVLGSI